MKWLQRQKLRATLEKNPYHRLHSSLEVAVAAELGIQIDVNRATIDEWLRISLISIHQARNLVSLSQMGVQFLSLEDLAAALNLSLTQIKFFEPILYFGYYEPSSLITPQRLNVNQASFSDLEGICLINSRLADAIIEDRQEKGSYKSLADLQNRLKLDGQLMSQLIHYLHC